MTDLKKAAAWLGRRGGKARARRLTAEQRSEIARNAALARHGKKRKPKIPVDSPA